MALNERKIWAGVAQCVDHFARLIDRRCDDLSEWGWFRDIEFNFTAGEKKFARLKFLDNDI